MALNYRERKEIREIAIYEIKKDREKGGPTEQNDKMSAVNWLTLLFTLASLIAAFVSAFRADESNRIAMQAKEMASVQAERQENYQSFWDPISLSVSCEKNNEGKWEVVARCQTGMFRSLRILYYRDGVLYNSTSAELSGELDVYENIGAEAAIVLENYTGQHGASYPASKAMDGEGNSLYFSFFLLAEGGGGDYELAAVSFESQGDRTQCRIYRYIDTLGLRVETDTLLSEYERSLFTDFESLNQAVKSILK